MGEVRVLSVLLLVAGVSLAVPAAAGPFDLEDDDKKGDAGAAGREGGAPSGPDASAAASEFGTYTPPPIATIRGHAYTLEECLALTDRNHPFLWAARARLAYVHAQLDEAKWVPFWQWNATFGVGVLPPILGNPVYTSSPATARNLSFTDGLQPLVQFNINGVIPLYTFGKITDVKEAAEAQVRVTEWDSEKLRQQTRMDVRRAYFGLMLSRDAKYLSDDILGKIDKGIEGINKKLESGDQSVAETDRLRLQVLREEIVARSGEPARGEAYAVAALRFLTGVQTAFDVPDEPLKIPDVPLAPLVRYLTAARIFRPEVNMARAGVVARRAQLDFARARLFPDLGLVLGADYARAPSAVTQNNGSIYDPFNHFYYYIGVGARWSLDIMPNTARIAEAEAQLEETRAFERAALGGLAVEVENSYATVVEAKVREEAWSRAEHKAKQWISTVQDAIDLGTRDETALTEPLRAYINARVNHLFALMDYNVNLSWLAQTSGWDSAAPTGK